MSYDFLVDTYETARIKVVSVWSEFTDDDLRVRPRVGDLLVFEEQRDAAKAVFAR
jgi:hypothetical protein